MLKNLFNNPWFIGLLGVFAAAYLAWSIAVPLLGSGSEVVTTDVGNVEFLEEVSAEANRVQSLAVEGRDQIQWLKEVDRDPFSIGQASAPTSNLGRPRLEALFISNGESAAVINNQFVREGDQIAQYSVERITKSHVQLRSRDGRITLTPEA